MDKIKIKDYPDYVKDSKSKAVLNTNISEILEYKKRKTTDQELQNLKNEVSSIKSDLNDIKNILIGFVDNLNSK